MRLSKLRSNTWRNPRPSRLSQADSALHKEMEVEFFDDEEGSSEISACTSDADAVMRHVLETKRGQPSAMPSYWDADEEFIEPYTLEEIKADPPKYMLWAAEHNMEDIVQTLLEVSPELVNARDEDLYTPLHRACYGGHEGLVKLLLTRGASITAQTVDGWQPLHSACHWNHARVASLLLQHGADINALTNGRQSPLHLAACNRDAKDLLQLLLMNDDIDATIRNDGGDTAEDLAIRNGRLAYLFEIVYSSLNSVKLI